MKSLSVLFSIGLVIFANLLALHLKRAGKLPTLIHEPQNPGATDVMPASRAGSGAAAQTQNL
jgi:hypothetical protein